MRGEKESVRIRFQDYGFFLPKDCRGMVAYAEGRIAVEAMDRDEIEHYREESATGETPEARDPRRVVRFTASGVRLVPAAAPSAP